MMDVTVRCEACGADLPFEWNGEVLRVNFSDHDCPSGERFPNGLVEAS